MSTSTETTIYAGAGCGWGYGTWDGDWGLPPLPSGPLISKPRIANVDQAREYIAGGYRSWSPSNWEVLQAHIDEVLREQGLHVYEAMTADPMVRSSIDTLKQAALADGITLMPAVGRSPDDQEDDPDTKESGEVHDFCRRCLDRLDEPIESVAYQLLDATWRGAMLAELVYEVAGAGKDNRKLVLKDVAVKPRRAWEFVVDRNSRPVGIAANVADVADGAAAKDGLPPGVRILPRDKFAILSWDPKPGDPRGTSILRSAFTHYNLKINLIPEFFKYLTQFAVPSLIGKVAEDAPPVPQADGTEISARQSMLNTLQNYRNALAMVIGASDEVLPLEVKGEGQAFLAAFDHFDRQIVGAILHQTRATMEASGSRGDAETGMDILALGIRHMKKAMCRCIRRDVLRPLVRLNYGEEAAQLYTPRVHAGETSPEDKAHMLTAYATAWSVGLLQPDQLTGMDAQLGLPRRKPGGLMDMLLIHEKVRQMAQDRMSAATAGSQSTKLAVPGTPGVEKPKPLANNADPNK